MAYITEDVEYAFKNNMEVTKETLFENDRYALISTFKNTAARVRPLLKNIGGIPYYEQMIEDLQNKNITLCGIVEKWTDFFMQERMFTKSIG